MSQKDLINIADPKLVPNSWTTVSLFCEHFLPIHFTKGILHFKLVPLDSVSLQKCWWALQKFGFFGKDLLYLTVAQGFNISPGIFLRLQKKLFLIEVQGAVAAWLTTSSYLCVLISREICCFHHVLMGLSLRRIQCCAHCGIAECSMKTVKSTAHYIMRPRSGFCNPCPILFSAFSFLGCFCGNMEQLITIYHFPAAGSRPDLPIRYQTWVLKYKQGDLWIL